MAEEAEMMEVPLESHPRGKTKIKTGKTEKNRLGLWICCTESTKEGTPSENDTSVIPEIYSMRILSNVSNRFARTCITSKVRNLKKKAAETTFSVILPENAYISEFEMEIKKKIYKAYVKEKKEAKNIYQQAASRGQSAAHVELSARDSKTFAVSVNIEPECKTIFRLVYEELLERRTGRYELVINIHPGQVVKDLGVEVHINESRPLTFIKTPSLRTGNEISKNSDKLDPSAVIEIIDSTSAVVNFNPDISQQKKFSDLLGSKKENGLAGQFVVQYDVERDPQGGEVLVRDGYFVHFFAPSELEPLLKHVVFVLDHSGSMAGTKFDQLVEAMQNILPKLGTEDLFNIVRFSNDVSIYNVIEDKFSSVSLEYSVKYGHLESHLRELNLPEAAEATGENVDKVKNIVKQKFGMGLTNIIGGLEVGLFLTKRTQEMVPNKYQSMIIFLTDGLPNVGIKDPDEITSIVTKLNSVTKPASIFSLSFGEDADKSFLRKLSAQNLGFSKHIYESADASLQLQDFYQTVSSPILNNVTFKYVDDVTAVTKTHHPILFRGSELVVAGKIDQKFNSSNFLLNIIAMCTTGRRRFTATQTEPVTSLERLWAYLTVKQILMESETADDKTELTKKALGLALKYSFVTSVSSLVVVRPNKTDSIETNVESTDYHGQPDALPSIPMHSRQFCRSSKLSVDRFRIPSTPSSDAYYSNREAIECCINRQSSFSSRSTPRRSRTLSGVSADCYLTSHDDAPIAPIDQITEESDNNVDIIEKSIGVFGRWHIAICFLIFLVKFPAAWHQLSIVFLSPPVDFSCIDNETDSCSQNCSEHIFDKAISTETIITQWDLVCSRSYLASFAQTVTMLGILFGSMLFGYSSDRFGRRSPLIVAVILQALSGTCEAFSPWFALFLIMRFLAGLATGGTMVISFVLMMEIVELKWRTTLGIIYQIPFNVGHLLLPLFSYFTSDWRCFQIAISLPSVILVSYYWLLPESPRWLLSVGKKDEAVSMLSKAAHHNKHPTDSIKEDINNYMQENKITEEKHCGNIVDLVRTPIMRMYTFCIGFNWLGCGLCFFGTFQYIVQLGENIFISVAISAVIQIPSTLLSIWAVKAWGRKPSLIISNITAGISCILIAAVPEDLTWLKMIFSGIAMFALAVSFATVYIYSGELFPTVVRNVGVGISSMCARIGSIAAPFIAILGGVQNWLPPVIFGIVPLIGAVLCLKLPETLNCKLPDTIEEAEKFAKKGITKTK